MIGVSARHISFLENDRSRPRRDLVNRIADVFNLKSRDQSNLLASAGFVPADSALDENSELMQSIRDSLTMALQRHDPYASNVVDRYGNIHMVNRAWVATTEPALGDAIYQMPLNSYRLFSLRVGGNPTWSAGKAPRADSSCL